MKWLRPRRAVAPSLVLAVALLAAARLSATADEPFKLNVILPLTGQASFLGKEEQVALQIHEKLVNGSGGIQNRPLQYVFYDDQSSPQVAVQLVKQVSAAQATLGPRASAE